jgi:tetratricopeptide (TPR) repeat protein
MTDGSRDPAPEPSRRASEPRAAATDAPVRRETTTAVGGTLGPAVIASRYRLERELGRGGAAIVWLAHDDVEDRPVAVKILRAEIADTVASDRFLEEIRIVTPFAHSRLLPILDSGEWDGLLYYVAPYVQGGSLRARLDRERQLPIGEALAIVRDVADALEYAHQHGVIHRDVKPENILLAADHAVVADFGIARALTRAAGDRITSTGISVGTPAYMSPEQVGGNPDVDHRSDIYSLGCVLYEMVTGVMPFVGPTPESVMAQRLLHAPHPMRVYRPTVPPHVESAVERAMATGPADRFRSMSAFADALADSARASEARVTRAQAPSRTRRLVIGGAIAVALVAAAAIALTVRSRAATSAAVGGADSTRWLVAAPSVSGAGASVADVQRRVAGALRRWRDLSVSSLPADANVRGLAARSRAGRVVVSSVGSVGDSLELTASLLGPTGDTLRRFAARAPRGDAGRIARLFGDAGAALTADAAVTGDADWSAALGTDRAAAWRAYSRARSALAKWDLEAAVADLRRAVALDPQYPAAQLWLAQTLAWLRPDKRLEWQQPALRARALAGRLPTFDSLLAVGVAHLALAEYPEARAAYERARALQPDGDVAWYGIAQSQASDDRVVRDRRSPSGWSFRSSFHSAAIAYDSAIAHAAGAPAFAFHQMRQLLFIDPFRLRGGRPAPPDTTAFAAHPSLEADTLAFVPHVASAVYASEPSTVPPTLTIVLRRSADRLVERMHEWVRRDPQSSRALSALAMVQEVRGEADLRDGGGLAALETFRNASRVAPDTAQLSLTASIVRLLVKEERFGDAHDLADSLLRTNPQPAAGQAKLLAGLAALTGELGRAERLLAIVESDPSEVSATSPPTAVSQAAAHLTAAAALGVCVPELTSMVREVEDRIDRYASPERRAALRREMLARPLSLAVPCLGAAPLATVSTGADPLGAMQLALGRHDPSAVREHFAALMRLRRGYLPGDVALDNTYQEAWLLMAIGDSARAEEHLCVPLSALPTMGTRLVSDVPQAAAVGRSLGFCARAAARRGDAAAAQRWARGLAALWATADAPLQPFIAEVRSLAGGSKR